MGMRSWEEFLKMDGWRSQYPCVDVALRHYFRRVRSEKTRANFALTLKHFCEFCNMTPDRLVKLDVESASRLCQEYTDRLKEKGCSIAYLNVCQGYLKTFFKENGFRNGRELRVEHYYQPSRYRKKPEYIPTPEEVYRMGYASGSAKNRAMIFM
ncbi:MAG: hypothetical protein QXI71_05470, partial [Candidatus Bathyarchaeia archaeon]